MLDIIVFNVEHGQSIFFYPHDYPLHGMLVDCGSTPMFNPVDFLVSRNLIQSGPSGVRHLGQLILTNYDHDHFSGLPHLLSRAHISTILFPHNLSSQDLIRMKPERTNALDCVCSLKDQYTAHNTTFFPPYTVVPYSLTKYDFPGGSFDTNNLSQVVFVAFGSSVICIAGDLEAEGWNRLLMRPGFQSTLRTVNIFVAAHHGRENGYAEEVFSHCRPEVILLSDKRMSHGTQEGMAAKYADHVQGTGVYLLQPQSLLPRRVLTTRKDGHLWITLLANGIRQYRTFTI